MERDSKKKIEKIIERLEETQGNNWKETIEQNKDEFEDIKIRIKENQEKLKELVKKRNAKVIKSHEFDYESDRIQQELYELESRIMNLRLKKGK